MPQAAVATTLSEAVYGKDDGDHSKLAMVMLATVANKKTGYAIAKTASAARRHSR